MTDITHWTIDATSHVCFPQGWMWVIALTSWDRSPDGQLAALADYLLDHRDAPETQLPSRVHLADKFGCPYDEIVSIGFTVRDDDDTARSLPADQRFTHYVDRYPGLAHVMRGFQLVRPYGERPYKQRRHMAYHCAQASGDGWVAVGDSTVLINPLFSPGMKDGLKQAQAAVKLVCDALDQDRADREFFAPYEQTVNALASIAFRETEMLYRGFRHATTYERTMSLRLLIGALIILRLGKLPIPPPAWEPIWTRYVTTLDQALAVERQAETAAWPEQEWVAALDSVIDPFIAWMRDQEIVRQAQIGNIVNRFTDDLRPRPGGLQDHPAQSLPCPRCTIAVPGHPHALSSVRAEHSFGRTGCARECERRMTRERAASSSGWSVSGLRRPRAFWLGTVLVVTGVCLHLPMLLGAADMHYMLVGMPWDGYMLVGMPLLIAGLGVIYYALMPQLKTVAREEPSVIRAAENTPLTRAHAGLIAVLLVAIAIDTIKPFTFTFILPGVAKEYALSTPVHHLPGHWSVGLFPLSGITGTAVGSIIWGVLGDRIGRRATILLSSVIFIATSMCGSMAPYWVNILICFIMGLSVGGLLPVAYALLTETIPARYRGQVIVLVAGAGTALGFLATSWAATWLMPTFGWRIMWYLGLPTGILLIALQRYLPESPRFLAATGRADEARAVMQKLGLVEVTPELSGPVPVAVETSDKASQLFRYPLRNLTIALIIAAVSWGLANFGFIVWLPTTVSGAGLSVASITGILAKAALFAFPGSALMAWLYGRWSSKGTVVLTCAVTGGILAVFAILGNSIARYPTLLVVTLIFLLVAMWGLISVLAPYSAEVYPVMIRARGAGVTAGASKAGGVAALLMSVLVIVPFDIHDMALIAAVPALLGALSVGLAGVETSYARTQPAVLQPAAAEPAE